MAVTLSGPAGGPACSIPLIAAAPIDWANARRLMDDDIEAAPLDYRDHASPGAGSRAAGPFFQFRRPAVCYPALLAGVWMGIVDLILVTANPPFEQAGWPHQGGLEPGYD